MQPRRGTLVVLAIMLWAVLATDGMIIARSLETTNTFSDSSGKPNHQKIAIHSVAVLGDSLVFLSTADLKNDLSSRGLSSDVRGYMGMPIDAEGD